MKEEDKLITKYGRDTGFKVPEGYFESLSKEVASRLPAYPEAPRAENLSMWQRLKPYLSLAAMFAGIWLMMQVFHTIAPVGHLDLDNPPESVVLALTDPSYSEQYTYMLPQDISDFELQKEVGENYSSIEEFEDDFGYELSPRYQNISLN